MVTGNSISKAFHAIDGLTKKEFAKKLQSFLKTQQEVARLIQLVGHNLLKI